MFDFMICGHVHNAWKVKKIAGMWHVNVGVDVNRYMPINDTEVVLLVEQAERGVK
jgi:calcineurin-like phosphoesterase family protein